LLKDRPITNEIQEELMMTLDELEKRIRALEGLAEKVQVLEDIKEIEQLQACYVNSLTIADWDKVVSCFAKKAIVDLHSGYVEGTEAISKLFREKISRMHVGLEGNFAVHPIISVDGDTAKGNWLMYIQFCRPRELLDFPPILGNETPDWMQGFYEMEYNRENGQWKISFLKWRRRLLSPIPLAERKA
jgi:hypothetical protein